MPQSHPQPPFSDAADPRDWEAWKRDLSRGMPKELRYSVHEIDPLEESSATMGFCFQATDRDGRLILTLDKWIDETRWRSVNADIESFGREYGYPDIGKTCFFNSIARARADKMSIHARASKIGAGLWARMGATLDYPEPENDEMFARQQQELETLCRHIEAGYDRAHELTLAPVPGKVTRALSALEDCAYEGWVEKRDEKLLWAVADDTAKVLGRPRGPSALVDSVYAIKYNLNDWGAGLRLREFMLGLK